LSARRTDVINTSSSLRICKDDLGFIHAKEKKELLVPS